VHAGARCPFRRACADVRLDDGGRLLRCRVHGRGHQDSCQPTAGAATNAICERVIGTLRQQPLDRLLIINERHLRQALTEYLRRYNTARPHRALGRLAPAQAATWPPEINLARHRIRRNQVLGGLTHEYQIAA
jgi:putative transposase